MAVIRLAFHSYDVDSDGRLSEEVCVPGCNWLWPICTELVGYNQHLCPPPDISPPFPPLPRDIDLLRCFSAAELLPAEIGISGFGTSNPCC